MIGGDRVRFCGQCELNVYNLSAMSTLEAESLIARTEGRLCVRYYRRKDGSIITQDCPVGLRALKQHASRVRRAAASAVLGFLAGLGVQVAGSRVGSFLLDSAGRSGTHGAMMGEIAAPRPQPREVVVGQMVSRTTAPAAAKSKPRR